jgi:recombination associated protein RdgC
LKTQPGRAFLRTASHEAAIIPPRFPPNTFFMEAQFDKQFDKILPEDLARTFESAYYVFQGETEHVDDLLKNGSVLLRKAVQRFTPTQMIIGIAVIATVAVVLISRASDGNELSE